MYKIRLSPYAKIFYTEWLLEPDSYRYNLAIDQTLYGKLDVTRLKTALKIYIAEHLLLNSHIQNINGEPYWVKNDCIDDLEYLDTPPLSASELSAYVSQSFDLHNKPLYRFRLIRVADDVYRFIIVMHHLVMDGSVSLDTGVFEAISNYYNDKNYTAKYSIGDQIKLVTNLADTISITLEQCREKHKEFWCKQLSDVNGIDLSFLKLNGKYDKNMKLSEEINSVEAIEFSYGKVESVKLNEIKNKYAVTSYVYGQCIFALLLYKYTKQERLAISYPIAVKEGLEFIYGAQINTNLIPYEFSKTTTIVDLFKQALAFFRSTTSSSDAKYNYYPITNILQEDHHKCLLNVCFAQTFFRDKHFSFAGIKKVEVSNKFILDWVTKDLLLFEQNPRNNELNYRVIYNKKIINEELLNNFVANYKRLFIEVLDDLLMERSDMQISRYSLLDRQQYQRVVYEFNQTEKKYPQDKTIHLLFEEQVLKTPNNIAVIYDDTSLTYQELNSKANQLAHYLRGNYDIKPDDLVAICLDRSELMLISILGVLKSGGAYVPLDPKLPDERMAYILNDTKSKVVITNMIYRRKLQLISRKKRKSSIIDASSVIADVDVVAIDDKSARIDIEHNNNPNTSIISSNLIYVLYTSGTTGNPKGVMLEHVSCVNRILEMIDTSCMLGNERVLFKTNYVFDVSFSDIFVALLTGATLVVTKNVFDIEEIADKIVDCAIDVCHFTPSQFEVIRSIKGGKLFERLKIINFSGEALYRKLLNGISKDVVCANYYGPTEAGEVTFENTKPVKLNGNIATIGRALHNVKLFVLDENLAPLPIGVVGELYISGGCLARGYLNNPQLTCEKFITNPLQTEQEKLQGVNGKLYKTGDLVRWLPDGNIEYIGRNDSQVKIRGYRIELGEVESQLLKFTGIKQAVAIISEQIADATRNLTADKHLVAYYVADRKLDETVLHDYLLTHLPEYMVPIALMRLSNLPLTPNGKLDIGALPKMQLTENYVAPNNQLQKTIVAIWSETLKLPKGKIGISESFFRLGGTSLSIIRLQHELSKIPKLANIKIADLFKYSTIEQLTEFIGGDDNNNEEIEISGQKNDEQLLDGDMDIAIIAVSGAFSGCKDVAEYWDLILQGKEGIKTTAITKCRQLGMPEEVLQNPNFLPRSGHVADVDKFDVKFWGITPNEAKNMDPQIRKFLEHCWYLLEMSGYAKLRHKINIGVFAGGGDSVYIANFIRQPLIVSGIGNLNIKDALATRVAYLLGLIGSANNINTACSTGLVTVIEACKSLAGNYCDMAIAGGSALLLPEEVGYVYQEGMIFSQDGHCRTFDHQASGTVHGSGVGAVLLKRLADAKKDGDNIVAVIKGYATNNDGNRKISYTAPSVIGQKECIVKAQKMARITSDMIDYVECHGTGTKLGDPVEIQALNEAFKCNTNENSKQHRCIIGAVKANIGHAGAAAGIASLIKVCQMLQHRLIPKQINFNVPNKELHLDETDFEVITTPQKWKKIGAKRMAGVSSFGIGGTNAHVIVSEYSHDNQVETIGLQKQRRNYIFPLSAKSSSSLEAYKKSFINYLASTADNIQDIAYTLQLKREHFDCRLSVVGFSVEEVIAKLNADSIERINIQKKHNVIFVFPGQGNQYANMSLGLYQHDSDYKEIVDGCIKLVNRYTNVQFEKILFPALFGNEAEDYDINQTEWAQPALFIVEYSLAKLLETMGINATSYIGHSIGEYVAATLAGIFSLEDAIKLVVARGQLMQSMPKGAMLSVQASAVRIEATVKNSHCEIAVVNSPRSCVASGTAEAIDKLKSVLDELDISAIPLKVSHGYHSSLMIDAAKKFIAQFDLIKLNKPQKRFISNLTGNFITAYEAVNPEYWTKHMCKAVLFSDGIKTLFNTYNNLVFVEVGAGKSSISFIKQQNLKKYNSIQLLNSQKDNSESVLDTSCKNDILNKLWRGGYSVDFSRSHEYKNNTTVVKLPNYQFDNSSYWINQLPNVGLATTKIDLSDDAVNYLDIKSKVVEQDLPEKYYDIAKLFLGVLGVEKISVHDSFSSLGGDSFLVVSLVAKLQQNYKISMTEFIKLQTIAKVAEFAPFVMNNLVDKLEQIKLIYAKRDACLERDTEEMFVKKAEYLLEAQNTTFKKQKKNIRNVLLTGVTGHVGCNILYKLLHETEYKIYLPVRAVSAMEASNRVNAKFRYYFETNLDHYKDRVVIFVSDLEQQDLGVIPEQYQELVSNVDSIIHSAALVKHYGGYDEAYRTNVQSTINLLELSKLTRQKDFHYISTIAVATEGYVPGRSYFNFNEDDDAGMFVDREHTYAITKYEGEVAVNTYRKYGVVSNIYRVGYVGMHSVNYRHQENIGDNYFFVQFKTILQLGMIYKELSEVNVAPVDCVADAIVKIFDQANLSNQIYHISNSHLCDLYELFVAEGMAVKMCSFDEFVDNVKAVLKTQPDNKQIELFMLHQKWLQVIDGSNVTKIEISQNKTDTILAKLGFYWPKITREMWADVIKRAMAYEQKTKNF